MEYNSPRQMNVIERADQGERAFIGKVYNYLAGGLGLSTVMAFLTTKEPLINLMYTLTPEGYNFSFLGWIAILAPFILIFMMNSAVRQANPEKAAILFWTFSALLGLSMGNIFLAYTGASIAQTFLVTAGAFLGLSIYGHATKRDLSGLGSFLLMGLIGIILASLINIFFHSSTVSFVVSVLGVFIFAGFTVYDTANIKQIYHSVPDERQRNALAISGALSLYLDFINLFQFLLAFLGDRR